MKTATEKAIEKAYLIAADAAINYLEKQGVQRSEINCPKLQEHLKRAVSSGFGDACREAKEAADIGMNEVAIQTFAAAMILSGINAAKAYMAKP